MTHLKIMYLMKENTRMMLILRATTSLVEAMRLIKKSTAILILRNSTQRNLCYVSVDGERRNHFCMMQHLQASSPNCHQKQMDSLFCISINFFWDNNISEHVVYHTNLYSVQQTRALIQTTAGEMETFFGIQMVMSLIKMPQYAMYWSTEFQYGHIASVMFLNRSQLFFMFWTLPPRVILKTKMTNYSTSSHCSN